MKANDQSHYFFTFADSENHWIKKSTNLFIYMNYNQKLTKIAGWLVFAIAMTVYFMTAERTGSLWDCGEFVLGAYKLQVVHPPGAAVFLLIGRLFIFVAEIFTDTVAHPENIAFAINLMSGMSTAFGAMFICWVTIMFGKLALVGREAEPDKNQSIALAGSGIIAGLSMAFCSSVWFSAVEGEVYAMSTFFTCLTLWAMMKWYMLSNSTSNDRWLVFAVFAGGLSIGVHLLSILTFPALALLYYFKKYKEHSFIGMGVAVFAGILAFVAIQKVVITGIPEMWRSMELLTVNGFGMPFFSGLLPVVLIIAGLIFYALHAVHKEKTLLTPIAVVGGLFILLKYVLNGDTVGLGGDVFSLVLLFGGSIAAVEYLAKKDKNVLQLLTIGATMVVIGFSTIGVVVIRANANTPINMNAPSDPMRLLPYLNREQYGERPLLYGPNFTADPVDNEIVDRYGQVEKEVNGKITQVYDKVDEKISYVYNEKDKALFPRMPDNTQNRPDKYRQWVNMSSSKPSFADNIAYFVKYQLGWMYWRYFMWNFAGRQNGEQGFFSWDVKDGHWISGIPAVDEAKLFEMDEMPETMKNNKARNRYFMLPFIFGLMGLFFHFSKRKNEALALLGLFIITGIGIIVYSNQPPSEPRERDYVLVGSFFTFCIWIGLGSLALFEFLKNKAPANVAAIVGTLVVLSAPILMGTQNFDDHTRRHHSGSRDYASNFLESCEPNAIIFTYGDNDTYPLWYAQEVENIRLDVRVVNLSLIAVDWYINQLSRKVNDSPPLKLTVPSEAYRGKKRNTVFYVPGGNQDREMTANDVLKFIGERHPVGSGGRRQMESHIPSKNMYLPVNPNQVLANGTVFPSDTGRIVSKIPIRLPGRFYDEEPRNDYLVKDELAILDVIASNIWDRPVYFAVTCRPDKMFGLQDYMQLEGLGMRIIPVKSQSDRALYVYGSGRVSVDHVYENVMNKYRWGNFDKEELFVDRSYSPSIQSHRVIIMRAARTALAQGDKKRSVDLIEKYFEAFPHKNFPYDYNSWQMMDVMIEADAFDNAKPHLRILATETADWLNFFESIDPKHLKENTGSFAQDFQLSMAVKSYILRAVNEKQDEAFLKEMTEILGDDPVRMPN